MQSQQNERKKQNQYIFVALDLDNSDSFLVLSAPEKIYLLAKRIEEICKILSDTQPSAEWIVIWREYGVCDSKNEKSISKESRDILKDVMKKLSKKYNNLTIIAGSTLTRVEKTAAVLTEVLASYDNIEDIRTYEMKRSSTPHIELNKSHVEKILQKNKNKLDSKVIVYTNKSRVYRKEQEYWRNKNSPIEEFKLTSNSVYQPKKDKEQTSLVKIEDHLSFNISICRDYQMNAANKKKLPASNLPIFHCLVSYGMRVLLDTIQASHGIIHIDKLEHHGMRYILAPNYDRTISVEMYLANVTCPVKSLTKLIKPIYPVPFQLLDLLETAILESKDDEYIALLKALKLMVLTPDQILFSENIDHYRKIFGSIKKFSEELYTKLIAILDSQIKEHHCYDEILDCKQSNIVNDLLLCIRNNDYITFWHKAQKAKTEELLTVINEMIEQQQIYALMQLIKHDRSKKGFIKEYIYNKLSFNDVSAAPTVKRLFNNSCQLSQHGFIFYKYFSDNRLFKSFIKIAKLYFSLEDYSSFMSQYSFFGKIKYQCKTSVMKRIEETLLSTDAVDLDIFYAELKKSIYGVYSPDKTSNRMIEDDLESDYYKSVVAPNFS